MCAAEARVLCDPINIIFRIVVYAQVNLHICCTQAEPDMYTNVSEENCISISYTLDKTPANVCGYRVLP